MGQALGVAQLIECLPSLREATPARCCLYSINQVWWNTAVIQTHRRQGKMMMMMMIMVLIKWLRE